jgi:folate-binding protein YgfZ
MVADREFCLLDARGVLAVSGPDRRAFLQGLVSNDVDKVSAAQARWAALLTAQGRYLFDFLMIEADGAFWLEAEAARLADLRRRLMVYRLRAKVALDERPDLAVAAVFGAAAPAALGLAAAEPGTARPFAGGVAFVDPRLAALGARAIVPRPAAPSAFLASGLDAADFTAYDRIRLEFGVPDGSRDLVPEKSLLLESGFDELHGIDWDKGCYIGQELTARTRYRGLVRRRLVPVAIDGPTPEPGAAVTADGHEVGEMRSANAGLGLALLRIEAALSGRAFAAGDAVVVPRPPAWLRLPPQPGTGDPRD